MRVPGRTREAIAHGRDWSVADQQVSQLDELGDHLRVAAEVRQLRRPALLGVAVLLAAASRSVDLGDLLAEDLRAVVRADAVATAPAGHGPSPRVRAQTVRDTVEEQGLLERAPLGVGVVGQERLDGVHVGVDDRLLEVELQVGVVDLLGEGVRRHVDAGVDSSSGQGHASFSRVVSSDRDRQYGEFYHI